MPDFKWQLLSFNFNHLGPMSLFVCAAIGDSSWFQKNILTRFGYIDNNMATNPFSTEAKTMLYAPPSDTTAPKASLIVGKIDELTQLMIDNGGAFTVTPRVRKELTAATNDRKRFGFNSHPK